MDINTFIKTFNQTMGTSFYLESVPEQSVSSRDPIDLFWMSGKPYALLSETHEQSLQLNLLKQLYHAMTTVDGDPVMKYLTGESPLVPERITEIVSPTRLILLQNSTTSRAEFADNATTLASQLFTVLWSSPFEANGVLILLEDLPQIADTLEAYCDTLASDYGLLVRLILTPPTLQHHQLPSHFKLIEQMSLVGPQRSGVIQFNAIITELIARALVEPDAMMPLVQYMPLESFSLLMDEEILKTADQFFKHNLNITDTAKAMYLHRNTLLYRLEKIQKVTGFDLRDFEHSWYFKLLLSILRLNTAYQV